VTRFIGITCHRDPFVLKTALERHDFDCTQMALNAALVGIKPGSRGMVINPAMKPSSQTVALPVATRKNLGVIAMKALAADGLVGQAAPEKLLYYSLSLPVVAGRGSDANAGDDRAEHNDGARLQADAEG
jgi:hypothetical protein